MKHNSNMSSHPKFSIIIPVLHEAHGINPLIDHLHNQHTDQDFEVIVVDGDPDRETLSAINHKGVIPVSAEKGRGRQMNAGAAIARGEILIFLHADTRLPFNALRQIGSAMEQKRYVGGVFDLGIHSDRLVFKIIAHAASLRSRLTRIPYGDQAIFMQKDYFNKIGGYREIPVMEDVELMQRVKKMGDKIWIISDRVSTSPRRWEKEGIVCCTLRNWILQSLYLMGVSPYKLAKFYRHGHEVYED